MTHHPELCHSTCPLCQSTGGDLVWENARVRVVLVTGEEGANYPGFCRVIWKAHVAEMTDLLPEERGFLMDVVFAVEGGVRRELQPAKINLASLGNVVPHLHWHVIPRWTDDPAFPAPIWAAACRPTNRRGAENRDDFTACLRRELSRFS